MKHIVFLIIFMASAIPTFAKATPDEIIPLTPEASDKLHIFNITLADTLGISFSDMPPYDRDDTLGGISFSGGIPPYYYVDTIMAKVQNPYPEWVQDVDWRIYDFDSDRPIGRFVLNDLTCTLADNFGVFKGYCARNDNKPIASGKYILQAFDKRNNEPVSEKYNIYYELPKLDIVEIRTGNFTTTNFWTFRVKVKNNNPYPVALYSSIISAEEDSIFDNAVIVQTQI